MTKSAKYFKAEIDELERLHDLAVENVDVHYQVSQAIAQQFRKLQNMLKDDSYFTDSFNAENDR